MNANAAYQVPVQQRRRRISRQEMLRRKRAIRRRKRIVCFLRVSFAIVLLLTAVSFWQDYGHEILPSTTIQRETKLFLGADNEETAELTVPMYDFGDWASRMKAYRKKNHITQQELAQLMGVKHFTLRSWEQKQAKPPYNVWRLHKHLFDDSIKLT